MKKTIFLLLSSVCVVASCYTSPEMNENKYRQMYNEGDPSSCRYAGDSYQHKGLRQCLEGREAWENANKKTVEISVDEQGNSVVVSKKKDAIVLSDNALDIDMNMTQQETKDFDEFTVVQEYDENAYASDLDFATVEQVEHVDLLEQDNDGECPEADCQQKIAVINTVETLEPPLAPCDSCVKDERIVKVIVKTEEIVEDDCEEEVCEEDPVAVVKKQEKRQVLKENIKEDLPLEEK